MNRTTSIILTLIILIGLVIVIIVTAAGGQEKGDASDKTALDSFAQCIDESGALFYGAFWCPHCQNQKTMFEKSAKYLPYIECSTPSRQQTQECIDAGIESYPTWEFVNGERLTGEVSLEVLSEKTSCTLPADISEETTEESSQEAKPSESQTSTTEEKTIAETETVVETTLEE